MMYQQMNLHQQTVTLCKNSDPYHPNVALTPADVQLFPVIKCASTLHVCSTAAHLWYTSSYIPRLQMVLPPAS